MSEFKFQIGDKVSMLGCSGAPGPPGGRVPVRIGPLGGTPTIDTGTKQTCPTCRGTGKRTLP
jgi:hypothetical protein